MRPLLRMPSASGSGLGSGTATTASTARPGRICGSGRRGNDLETNHESFSPQLLRPAPRGLAAAASIRKRQQARQPI